VHEVEKTLAISTVLVILVGVRVPQERSRDVHPERRSADLADRYILASCICAASRSTNLFPGWPLTISTGFVVDDAIVVIENVTRYLEQGMAPMAGGLARRAGNRLHRAEHQHIAGSRSFIPLLLMGGIVGRLFRGVRDQLSRRRSWFPWRSP